MVINENLLFVKIILKYLLVSQFRPIYLQDWSYEDIVRGDTQHLEIRKDKLNKR